MNKSSTSILLQPVNCPKCGWRGPVVGCEPDDEGELHCPNCTSLLVVTVNEETSEVQTRLG